MKNRIVQPSDVRDGVLATVEVHVGIFLRIHHESGVAKRSSDQSLLVWDVKRRDLIHQVPEGRQFVPEVLYALLDGFRGAIDDVALLRVIRVDDDYR